MTLIVACHCELVVFQVAAEEKDPELTSLPFRSHFSALKVMVTFDWQLPAQRSRYTASRETHTHTHTYLLALVSLGFRIQPHYASCRKSPRSCSEQSFPDFFPRKKTNLPKNKTKQKKLPRIYRLAPAGYVQ